MIASQLLERTIAVQPPEKRRNVRRSMRYPGIIDLGDDQAAIACTLCNASQEGAQLLVDAPRRLPNHFTLVLGYDGTARRFCRVVWRTETQVGVEFLKGPARSASRRSAPAIVGEDSRDAIDIDSLPAR